MEFREYLIKIQDRLKLVESLYGMSSLTISYDKLKRSKSLSNDVLFFKINNTEFTGIFLFGINFFIDELSEQEFKKILGQNSLNLKIYKSYNILKSKSRKVKVSDIINELHNKKKDSIEIHNTLKRILTLSYYFNWELIDDKKDIEGDKILEMKPNFAVKLRQRFSFDAISPVYENKELFIFLNSKGKLNVVFKAKEKFTKEDIEKLVFPAIRKVFNIKKVETEN